jgi:hypothetical protein
LIFYHGTGSLLHDLRQGTYVTPDFGKSVMYALINPNPVIVAVEIAPHDALQPAEDERAYDNEFVLARSVQVVGWYEPNFRGKPEDWYEVNETCTDQKYPELFEEGNWDVVSL